MIKNIAYAAWGAAYIIFLRCAYFEKNDQLWVVFLILFISMPLVLLGLLKSISAAVPLRAALVILQLPFAILFLFRYLIIPKWYGVLIMAYLGISAVIGFMIRRKFPQDVNKF